MRDNELIQIFLDVIRGGLVARGYNDVVVKQSNQPTQQGAVLSPTVYFSKVSDVRYGFPGSRKIWDEMSQTMRNIQTQSYQNTYQFNAFVRNDPAVLSFTAADLLNDVASTLQTEEAAAAFNAADVGVLRIRDIREPFFQDDLGNFEMSPSFDAVFCTHSVFESTVPVLTEYGYAIYPV